MGKRRKILVPEARKALDELKAKVAGTEKPEDAKFEIAKENGVPLSRGYNGQLTAYEAGKTGGKLGGRMVQELIKMAKGNLENK
ncbi:alpha/beta-type small acid-soluble spore protein [Neobacillus sp. PS3-34]|uniref:alpha/beta-type small acid-soluble spore protein n=1 Tax=Neobacillus sp. PS3-34 TaxID=3070678 RepID=UPI0027E19E02|nr:alpha/beta-type small acid-soluble spore protein [Neobacillus sp. PS3-34]WML48101.1 alpha/beta-type small acid-soluble spore protein [Neobacillus sp. PS3-34]